MNWKNKNVKTIFILLFSIYSSQFYGQFTNNTDLETELRQLLEYHSIDYIEWFVDEYCAVLDRDIDENEYRYYLQDVIINPPESEGRNFYINLTCNSYSEECILLNRKIDIPGKNFVLRNKKVADRVFEILRRLKENCE